MIDFHTHILPGIDDGSKDIEMTEKMLEAEAEQGVRAVYATPHFYAHRRNVAQFLEKREHSLDKVRELLARRPDLPSIVAGAEVYYFRGMGRAEQLPKLCVEGTRVLLLEMPFEQWTGEVLRDVTQIIRQQQLQVILAHVERYYDLQRDKGVWEAVMDLPVMIQMNAGSFLKFGLGRRWCMKLLTSDERTIIGTDCHNLTSRPPNLLRAREYIQKKAGADVLTRIDRLEERILHTG